MSGGNSGDGTGASTESSELEAGDRQWMQLALDKAHEALGRTWPNPAVGCVLVQRGVLVSSAATAEGGRPHAETQAIAQAGVRAAGSTAYVTLEPCSHVGVTPPCAASIVEARIARVVIATLDPDPRVGGAGVELLREAGIQVDIGCLESEARRANVGFFSRVARQRPWCCIDHTRASDSAAAGELARLDARLLSAATLDAVAPIHRAPQRRVLVVQRGFSPRSLILAAQGLRPGELWILHGSDVEAPSFADEPEAASVWRDAPRRIIAELDRNSTSSGGGNTEPLHSSAVDAVLQTLAMLGLTRIAVHSDDEFAPHCSGEGTLRVERANDGNPSVTTDAGLVDRALSAITFPRNP